MVTDNNLAFQNPDLRIGPHAHGTKVIGNYFETNLTGYPAVQFGDPSDAPNTYTDGLMFTDNSVDEHYPTAAFLGYASVNSLLSNAKITNLYGWEVNTSSVIAIMNPSTGQTGNQASGICTMTATTPPCAQNLNVHTPSYVIAPWLVLDQGIYNDPFLTAGALGSPWLNTTGEGSLSVTSGKVAVTAPGAYGDATYLRDVGPNVRVSITISAVPTGSDQLHIDDRGSSSVSGTAGLTSRYFCVYAAGVGLSLYKDVSGSYTQLGSTFTTVTPSVGDRLTLESIGSQHTCTLQHAGSVYNAIGPINDTDLSTGYAAIGGQGTSGSMSLFAVQSLQ